MTFIFSFLILLGIDAVWLSVITKDFYQKQIGFLFKKNPDLLAAGLFYIIFCIGLSVFVINPALQEKSISKAILLGALFGLVSYATYDLTNMATIKDWPVLVTIVDLVWGSVLAATVSGLSYFLLTKFK